ncbi:MAG: citramalate synthase [Nitrososphaeria archaeon]
MELDVEVLDTTLRDGAQASGVSFTLQDKLSITEKLDELGISYVEGGWPASNPKDLEYFSKVKELGLSKTEVVAFGSTKRRGTRASEDQNLGAIVRADVRTAVIVGKSWTLHVKRVLGVTPEENLEIVRDSLGFLRSHGVRVIFDAEHFFDGYREDPEYAVSVLRAAEEAGAERIVLADTNGGSLPHEVGRIVGEVRKSVRAPLGIHAHNDSGNAVANSIMAVVEGAAHVQGTINGIGERCGNADLIQVLPALVLKMGLKALKGDGPGGERLRGLTALSRHVYRLLNMPENPYQPYVGSGAFSHKGGIHIDAMLKEPRSYEHVDPELVGNHRRMRISELAGRAALLSEARRLGLDIDKDDPALGRALDEIKRLEAEGYSLEDSDATVHLILMRSLDIDVDQLDVVYWSVGVSREEEGDVESVADVIVKFGHHVGHGRGRGVGPVHALDSAMRTAAGKLAEELTGVSLVNYKVSVVDSVEGTASKVRVYVEFSDGRRRWSTTALSRNIVEASLRALVDGYNYTLLANHVGKLRSARQT